jgi:hypothetical protein
MQRRLQRGGVGPGAGPEVLMEGRGVWSIDIDSPS